MRHRGAGIFLHVNGRGATAGCVSVPRSFMRSTMVRLDPARVAGDRDRTLSQVPKESRTETPVEVEGRHLTLVNLEKVMYPRTGTTKGEVLNYYARVAPVMLPHLADRAVTRIRWPNGTSEQSFFEKNVPGGTPSWVRTVTVPTTGSRTKSGEEGELTFPVIDSLAVADLAGQPRLARAARAPVDGHQVGQAAQPQPAGRSTSTPASRPAWGSARRSRCS